METYTVVYIPDYALGTEDTTSRIRYIDCTPNNLKNKLKRIFEYDLICHVFKGKCESINIRS